MTTVTSIVGKRAAATEKAKVRATNARTIVFLWAVVGVLLVIGLGATTSASAVVSQTEGLPWWHFTLRQGMWIALGLVVALLVSRIPYRLYARFAWPILILAIAGLVATALIGDVVNGSRRWIDLGPFDLQTSEFAKFGVVVFLAATLAKKGRELRSDYGHFLVPVVASLGVTAALIMAQPDLGTTLIVAAGAFGVVIASRAPFRYVVGTGLVGAVAAGILAFSAPYRFDRISGWLNPEADPLGTGYQLIHSLRALGSGGVLGVGLGESRARWQYLPNAHTDFIFSIVGEELGFAGAIFVVVLFVALGAVCLAISMRAKDEFGRLLGVGITTWLSAQAIVNIGGTVGAIPITGMVLPFVSYGGSALIVAMAAVGVLTSIARESSPNKRRR